MTANSNSNAKFDSKFDLIANVNFQGLVITEIFITHITQ